MKFQNNYEEEFVSMKAGRQILKVTESTYDEDYGCVSVKLTSKDGANLYKSFYIMKDDEVNESVKRALDFFAWKALGHRNAYEESDLENKYVEVDVIKDEYQSEKKGKTIWTIDLWTTEGAKGFGKAGGSGSSVSGKKQSADDIDLDSELDE